MTILDIYLEKIQSKIEQVSTGGVTTSVSQGITPYETLHKKKKPFIKSKIKSPLTEQLLEEAKRIMIDFDGTVHRYSKGFGDGTIYDSPTDFAREALSFLKNEGFEIVIFTTRLSKEACPDTYITNEKFIKEWLVNYDIPYDRITAEKLPAMIYIDDKSLRFADWKDTLNILEDLKIISRE